MPPLALTLLTCCLLGLTLHAVDARHRHGHQHHSQSKHTEHGSHHFNHRDHSSHESKHHDSSSAAAAYTHGLAYHSPHSHSGLCASPQQIQRELQTISQYTNRIRTYSVNECDTAYTTLQTLYSLNMTMAMGMWLTTQNQWHTNTSDISFGTEKAALLQLIDRNHTLFAHTVKTIIVGSECQFRKEISAKQLANYVDDIKQMLFYKRLPQVSVTVADTLDNWLVPEETATPNADAAKDHAQHSHKHHQHSHHSGHSHQYHRDFKKSVASTDQQQTTFSSSEDIQRLIHEVDHVMVHAYPFYEGVHIDKSVDHLTEGLQKLKKQLSGSNRQVVLGETGFPSEGLPNGEAVPSPDNAYQYYNQLVCRLRQEAGLLQDWYYFEAIAESWKAEEANDGLHTESSFGLLREGSLTLKYPFESLDVKC